MRRENETTNQMNLHVVTPRHGHAEVVKGWYCVLYLFCVGARNTHILNCCVERLLHLRRKGKEGGKQEGKGEREH